MHIVLASQSPRRRELLERAGFSLTVAPADIDERPSREEPATRFAERMAFEKAEVAMSATTWDGGAQFLIAADTVVWIDEATPLGKPDDEAHARDMLQALAGIEHTVTTAWTAIAAPGLSGGNLAEQSISSTVSTRVRFYPMQSDEIDAYIRSGEPFGKAGAYAIQGLGAAFVERIDGCYDAVVGLPVADVIQRTRARGWIDAFPWEMPMNEARI